LLVVCFLVSANRTLFFNVTLLPSILVGTEASVLGGGIRCDLCFWLTHL